MGSGASAAAKLPTKPEVPPLASQVTPPQPQVTRDGSTQAARQLSSRPGPIVHLHGLRGVPPTELGFAPTTYVRYASITHASAAVAVTAAPTTLKPHVQRSCAPSFRPAILRVQDVPAHAQRAERLALYLASA